MSLHAVRNNLIAVAIVGFLLCWVFGAFDVFLAQNNLPFEAHQCMEFGNIFHLEYYCDGPWSSNPFTPAVQACADKVRDQPGLTSC